MNDIVECYNYFLIKGVIAFLIQTNLPKGSQAKTVCNVNYLKNRYPQEKLNGKVPLNIWRG